MQRRIADTEYAYLFLAAIEALVIITAIALLITACGRPPTGAARQQIDMATPWTMHTLVAGASSGTHVGADGVDIQRGVAAVGWEQGNSVTTTVLATGVTTTYSLSQSGPEDVKLCDLDKDGTDDLVIASSGKHALYVIYGGTPTWVQLTASATGHGYWIQAGCFDADGDGYLDVVGGSYAGTAANPAEIAVFYNPGSRTGAWGRQQLTLAGWAMSVIPVDYDGDGDIDIVVTDRAAVPGAASPYALMGARWIERVTTTPATWANHTILGAPYAGDEMFGLVLAQGLMLEGRSHSGQSATIAEHGTTNATLYTDTDTGRHFQGAAIGDLDQDGLDDLAVTTWESNTCCSDTVVGVYWLHNTGSGYTWGNVEGGPGTKHDNVLLRDMDGDGDLDIVVTEEQNQLGLVWYENPLSPVEVDGPPDAAVDAPHECGAP